jgi:hypothetical protein
MAMDTAAEQLLLTNIKQRLPELEALTAVLYLYELR